MSYSCRILAIDGGGIRGVIPAYILAQIESALGKPIYQCFDIIAGTSTGGLISLGLTTPAAAGAPPRSAETILDLYMNDESQLFVYQSTGDYDEAEYYGTNTSATPNTGVEPWIYSLFGGTTLSQAQQQLKALGNKMPRQVLTTSYTLTGAAGVPYGPYLFNWISAAQSSADDYCVWEAARATSAAPTYFPLANVGAGAVNGSQAAQRWACDGGITANNPGLYALAQAFGLGLCQNLSDVLVVSLGTGLYNAGIAVTDDGNWGAMYDWTDGSDTNGNDTAPLLNVLTMSNQMAPHQQLGMILPTTNYFRFEPLLTYGQSSMDGTDSATLKKIATDYIAAGGDGAAAFDAVVAALKS